MSRAPTCATVVETTGADQHETAKEAAGKWTMGEMRACSNWCVGLESKPGTNAKEAKLKLLFCGSAQYMQRGKGSGKWNSCVLSPTNMHRECIEKYCQHSNNNLQTRLMHPRICIHFSRHLVLVQLCQMVFSISEPANHSVDQSDNRSTDLPMNQPN